MAPLRKAATDSTLMMLLERLNWPLRMVRWMAAREYAALLSSPKYRDQARGIYLTWLSERTLESQVISGLAVLLCVSEGALPAFAEIAAHINRPSLLSDIMVQQIYGFGRRTPGWTVAHIDAVPDTFQVKQYFDEHKSAHVPTIFSNHIRELEERTGFPFMRQWAFEWQHLMDTYRAPYSDFPYFFVGNYLRTGVVGQFDLAQSDVYRSAYLRTLAFGVTSGVIPLRRVGRFALDCLPLNRGLLDLRPVPRPSWLSDLPEKCCEPGSDLESLARELVQSREAAPDARPVSLHIPIRSDLYQFGELFASAVLATADFVPNDDDERYFSREGLWALNDSLSYAGPLNEEHPLDFLSRGKSGFCLPVCLSLTPLPFGYWHGEYFHSGMALPAAYLFEKPPVVSCASNEIIIAQDGDKRGSLAVWHDHWTPLYAKGGNTRCGMITELQSADITSAGEKFKMRLGWTVQLRLWKQASDYSEFEMTTCRQFFFD